MTTPAAIHTYAYPRPAVAVDTVIFRQTAGRREVLLIKRARPPFQGLWAFPGGHVEPNEALEVAAARELEEETGVKGGTLTQIGTFGDPGRDPRGWYISVVFMAVLTEPVTAVAGDDAAEAAWFAVDSLPALAFDHAKIMEHALHALITK